MARTIEFDREQVLENAMETFWRDGYNQTNIPSLTKATRLQPGSLYAAFGSKEGLLLAALEHYSNTRMQQMEACLGRAETPLKGVKALLTQVTNEVTLDNCRRGCFLVNTLLEMSPQNKTIQEQAIGYLNGVEIKICAALQTARDGGELAADKDPEVLANFLMVNIWGLRVLSKTNPPDKTKIKHVLEQLFACLD